MPPFQGDSQEAVAALREAYQIGRWRQVPGASTSHVDRIRSILASSLRNQPTSLRFVLDVHRTLFPMAEWDRLRANINVCLPGEGIVYAILFTDSHQIYVGHTAAGSPLERLRRHLQETYLSMEKAKHLTPFHVEIARNWHRGFSNCFLVPLEAIPHRGSAALTRKACEAIEDAWMQRLQQGRPALRYGLRLSNKRREGLGSWVQHYLPHLAPADIPHQWRDRDRFIEHCTPRVYGGRDWARRIHALGRRYEAACVDAASKDPSVLHHPLLHNFSSPTLLRMRSVLIGSPYSALGLTSTATYTAVFLLLTAQLRHCFMAQGGRPPSCITLPKELQQVVSKAEFYRLLRTPALVQLLPRDLAIADVRLRMASGQPLSSLFMTYKAAAAMSMPAILQVIAGPCSCHRHPTLCPPGIGHILSTAPEGLLPPDLYSLWCDGGRCRAHQPIQQHPDDPTPEATLLRLCEVAVTDWVDHEVKRFGGAIFFRRWQRAFIGHLSALLASRRLPFAVVAPPPEPGRGSPWHTPLFTPELRRHDATRDCVITCMDKSSATLVLICRKLYFTWVLKDLEPVAPPAKAFFEECSHAVSTTAFIGVNQRLTALRLAIPVTPATPVAYYAATVKFHKQPPKMRFLTCSQDTPLTWACEVLCWLLSTIQLEYRSVWRKLGATYGVDIGYGFTVINTGEVMPFIHSFNAQMAGAPPPLADHEGLLPITLDFERLYTDIPLVDLQNRLQSVIAQVFDLHQAAGVQFTSVKKSTPVWLRAGHQALAFGARGLLRRGTREGDSAPRTCVLEQSDIATLLV